MATPTAVIPDDRRLLLRIVEEAYDLATWNETNLRSTIRRVLAEEAGWRPRHARRNIAEIVLHCAYWKYALRRRLLDERRGSFSLKGTNWFEVPRRLSKEQWSDYVALLDEEHKKLCRAVRGTEKELLYSSSSARDLTQRVFGVAMHDAYHTGQIRLIRAIYGRMKKNKKNKKKK